MPSDTRNHVCKAKRTLQLSKLNQEIKIEEWQKSTPSSNHFFRPYIKKSDMQVDQDGQTSSSDDVQSSASCDDVPDDCSQAFLCLKMIDWQHLIYPILRLLYRGVLQRPLHKTLVSLAFS